MVNDLRITNSLFFTPYVDNTVKPCNFATPNPKGGRKTFFTSDFSGSFQSGQMDQTVNLLVYAFGGSNPPLPTISK